MESMNKQLFNDREIEGDQDRFLAGTGCVLTSTATPLCTVVGGCDTDTDALCTP